MTNSSTSIVLAGCIYEIFYKKDPRYKYVGRTSVSLEERFKQHIRCCNNNKTNNKFYNKVKEFGGFKEFDIKIIKTCETLDDLHNGEMYFIQKNYTESNVVCLNTQLKNTKFKNNDTKSNNINFKNNDIIIYYDEDGDVIMVDNN